MENPSDPTQNPADGSRSKISRLSSHALEKSHHLQTSMENSRETLENPAGNALLTTRTKLLLRSQGRFPSWIQPLIRTNSTSPWKRKVILAANSLWIPRVDVSLTCMVGMEHPYACEEWIRSSLQHLQPNLEMLWFLNPEF